MANMPVVTVIQLSTFRYSFPKALKGDWNCFLFITIPSIFSTQTLWIVGGVFSYYLHDVSSFYQYDVNDYRMQLWGTLVLLKWVTEDFVTREEVLSITPALLQCYFFGLTVALDYVTLELEIILINFSSRAAVKEAMAMIVAKNNEMVVSKFGFELPKYTSNGLYIGIVSEKLVYIFLI